MKNKVLIKGPALSYSQYGELCREVINDIRKNEENDVYILNTGWGNSGWLCDDGEFRDYVDSLIMKTSSYISEGTPHFDICVQVSYPSEWKRMANINVGVFNGSDTIASSTHHNTGYEIVDSIVTHSENQKAAIPEKFLEKVMVIPRTLGDKITTKKTIFSGVTTDYNFLCSFKWEPKNNIEQVMSSFFQEFQNEPVGLILNTYIKTRSTVDREYARQHLSEMMSIFPRSSDCKMYLLHGDIGDDVLYADRKVCAFVDTRHTMEYDSSLFKAVRAGIPIIASNWGAASELSETEAMLFSPNLDTLKDRHILEEQDKKHRWNYPEQEIVRKSMRQAYDKKIGSTRNYKSYKSLLDKRLNFYKKMNYNKLITDLMENNNETK